MWRTGITDVVTSTFNGVVIVVFALSAAQKLREPEIAADAIRRFGFGRRNHRSAAFALGVAEGGLALALAMTADILPRVVACGLLALFVALLSRAVVRGERFACGCFGGGRAGGAQLLMSLARTASLFVVAAVVLALGMPAGADGVLLYQGIVAGALVVALTIVVDLAVTVRHRTRGVVT